jgi:hypothetical protein
MTREKPKTIMPHPEAFRTRLRAPTTRLLCSRNINAEQIARCMRMFYNLFRLKLGDENVCEKENLCLR